MHETENSERFERSASEIAPDHDHAGRPEPYEIQEELEHVDAEIEVAAEEAREREEEETAAEARTPEESRLWAKKQADEFLRRKKDPITDAEFRGGQAHRAIARGEMTVEDKAEDVEKREDENQATAKDLGKRERAMGPVTAALLADRVMHPAYFERFPELTEEDHEEAERRATLYDRNARLEEAALARLRFKREQHSAPAGEVLRDPLRAVPGESLGSWLERISNELNKRLPPQFPLSGPEDPSQEDRVRRLEGKVDGLLSGLSARGWGHANVERLEEEIQRLRGQLLDTRDEVQQRDRQVAIIEKARGTLRAAFIEERNTEERRAKEAQARINELEATILRPHLDTDPCEAEEAPEEGRKADEWAFEYGDVLWFLEPITEAPWLGEPRGGDFPWRMEDPALRWVPLPVIFGGVRR